ncbi:phospholipase D3 [Drosophila pseudoobscura]|uniref:Phospholipase D3 n=1 Tax=Drosophila pseudoobscura pseudoobscura TaxID=46245 RepID=A0A6I8ULX7_DROPS|nr:phospholipase D3 [Drosophila pseudoobscura]
MSERRGVQDIPVDYQPVATQADHIPSTSSCCRRPNCNIVARDEREVCCCGHGYIIPVFILFVLVLIVLLLPWETFHRNEGADASTPGPVAAAFPCQLQLVESLPTGLNYSGSNHPQLMVMTLSTFEAWQLLLGKAKTSVDIAAPYWTLRGVGVNDSSSTQHGDQLFQRLLSNGDAGRPKLRIRIALNRSQESIWHADARIFSNYGAADVVAVERLRGNFWIVDGQHFYLGSANMDWRSLSQRKEMGVLGQNCPHLTRDLGKIFKAYWYLGSNDMPSYWPWIYHTNINQRRPLLLNVNMNYTMHAYISSSPPPLAASGRAHELDAVLNAIDKATELVCIALVDYYPLLRHESQVEYWPLIDNALRKAAVERGVVIKLLISWWKYSDPSEDHFLRSLQALSQLREEVDIEIRRFVVPTTEAHEKIAHGRVSHNSYMVTEDVVYIGTSSWSGEQFTYSAGVGLVLHDMVYNNNSLRTDLLAVFHRDWFSPFSLPLKHNFRI